MKMQSNDSSMLSGFHYLSPKDVSGYTLIMPAISVGNVGQLTVDLLISTLKPSKWAYVWHQGLIDTVGGDPYDPASQDNAYQCEVFVNEQNKMVILQLRSCILKGYTQSFLQYLLAWAKEQKLTRIVTFASMNAQARQGNQLQGSQLRYFASPDVDQSCFQDLAWSVLERRGPLGATDFESEFHAPGAGFTRRLFKMCCLEGIPFVGLLKFCYEGDNALDAEALANYANLWLKVLPRDASWRVPHSWCNLYGSPPPVQIY